MYYQRTLNLKTITRISICDIPVDALTMEETLQLIDKSIIDRKPIHHVVINEGEPPNPEEERRLCYVGMTRARERLVLTRASNRVKRGRDQPRTPSRFLGDIPEGLTEGVDLAGAPTAPPDAKEQNFFANLKERLKAGKASP